MKVTSFDTQIHSDEFATEYEEFLALLDEQWEEPKEWKTRSGPIV